MAANPQTKPIKSAKNWQLSGAAPGFRSWGGPVYDTIRYDTRCYFNVRSKADISQLNLPHGTDN